MPVLRIQDLVAPKRPPAISHYSNGTSFTTSDILWRVFSTGRQPCPRDPRGRPRRFPFYFLFKKRQVEMTTPVSRVFPGPWSNPVSSRAQRGIYGAVGPGFARDDTCFVARSCVCSRVLGSADTNIFRGGRAGDSRTQGPPMPMPSAFTPSTRGERL
jgi:hypothetical protein